MSSLVRVASILLSFILIAGNTIDPVPDASNTKSAFDDFVRIVLSRNDISELTTSKSYTSLKLLLILAPATLIVSPVPSLAPLPISITC